MFSIFILTTELKVSTNPLQHTLLNCAVSHSTVSFGTQLKDMLCDRLVVGVRDDVLRRKLMTQTDTSFKKAQEIAIVHETAVRDTVASSRPTSTSAPAVHLVNHRQ